jgi:hypothetical protein
MVVMGELQMTLSFCGCKADAERPVAEFVQSKTEGLAALTTDPGIMRALAQL